MYAIVRSGGKQLKVVAGDVVRIEKPAGERIAKGESLALSGADVILVSGENGIRTGAEALKGV
ncbi:MAG TPA: bL21 family ribosomal protein, partial [Thermoanaerobaculia bacterium]